MLTEKTTIYCRLHTHIYVCARKNGYVGVTLEMQAHRGSAALVPAWIAWVGTVTWVRVVEMDATYHASRQIWIWADEGPKVGDRATPLRPTVVILLNLRSSKSIIRLRY